MEVNGQLYFGQARPPIKYWSELGPSVGLRPVSGTRSLKKITRKPRHRWNNNIKRDVKKDTV
jgi:hypothetical protein